MLRDCKYDIGDSVIFGCKDYIVKDVSAMPYIFIDGDDIAHYGITITDGSEDIFVVDDELGKTKSKCPFIVGEFCYFDKKLYRILSVSNGPVTIFKDGSSHFGLRIAPVEGTSANCIDVNDGQVEKISKFADHIDIGNGIVF